MVLNVIFFMSVELFQKNLNGFCEHVASFDIKIDLLVYYIDIKFLTASQWSDFIMLLDIDTSFFMTESPVLTTGIPSSLDPVKIEIIFVDTHES